MSELTQKDYIDIKGAREHNLKGIDVKIPRNKMVVLTGLSGSGKSSLAFDTIYAEGQRRYMSRCLPMRDSSLGRWRSQTWRVFQDFPLLFPLIRSLPTAIRVQRWEQ